MVLLLLLLLLSFLLLLSRGHALVPGKRVLGSRPCAGAAWPPVCRGLKKSPHAPPPSPPSLSPQTDMDFVELLAKVRLCVCVSWVGGMVVVGRGGG